MTTTDMTPYEKYQALYGPDGFLASYNVEREDEIELLGLSTFSAVDCLFLGDPGVGKTWMIELQLACIVGAELFDILLLKEMSADDVLGPRSLPALKDGRIERIIQGYLPTAHYAYVDEVFKASPPLLNALLDLMAKRQLKIGGKVIDCSQLISIYFSSNELPDREDLMAMRDRIGITKEVKPVRTDEGKLKVTDIQLGVQGGGIDMTDAPQFTLPEIAQVRARSSRSGPRDREEVDGRGAGQVGDAGHPPSQRRMGQMWRVIKTHAWAKGQDEVTNDNLIVCAAHGVEPPGSRRQRARGHHGVRGPVHPEVANRIRIALEPQLTKLDELRGKLDSDDGDERDKAMEEAWSVMRSLRTLRKDAKAEIERGKASGHDVRELEKVRSEINRAHDYAESAFSDDDENGNGD
jgi:MoxR-like ATPase